MTAVRFWGLSKRGVQEMKRKSPSRWQMLRNMLPLRGPLKDPAQAGLSGIRIYPKADVEGDLEPPYFNRAFRLS
jgi:hypothetical protein